MSLPRWFVQSAALRAGAVAAALALAGAAAHAGAYEDFFTAVKRDNGASITELVQRGVDPNSRDPQGQLAMTLALRDENLKAAEALFASPGFQVDAANAAGETPLMVAALRGRLDWCRRLIERGAAVNRPGWTPLHYAASGPEPKAVALLLERGADVDASSPNGTTPLMMAARYGSEDSVQLLLDRNADVNRRNDRGLFAADFARANGRESLARRLDSPAK
jgi:ankyrin repeat protein